MKNMNPKSDLEILVCEDMITEGFNPSLQEDIELYWSERLEDD